MLDAHDTLSLYEVRADLGYGLRPIICRIEATSPADAISVAYRYLTPEARLDSIRRLLEIEEAA